MSTYYWDKAYRDFRLKDAEKLDMVMKGIESVDKAISIKDDYMEAIAYKNLLLRLQANLIKDPGRQQALIREADQLRDRAEQMRKAKKPPPASRCASWPSHRRGPAFAARAKAALSCRGTRRQAEGPFYPAVTAGWYGSLFRTATDDAPTRSAWR